MGYWGSEEDGSGLIWGDQPADIVDEAISEIVATFRQDWNRNPTLQEIIDGLAFSLPYDNEQEWQDGLQEGDSWEPEGPPRVVTSIPGLLNAIPGEG